FMGVPYVCKHCYKGYTKITEHWCKYVCNVCYDQDCYKNKGRDVSCGEYTRCCHSSYCFEKHKQQSPRRASGMLITPCDVTKYCRDCNRRYDMCVENPKPHRCAPASCHHCKPMTLRHGSKMENTQLILHAPLPAM